MYAHSKHSTILFLLLFFILSNFVSFDMNTAYKSNNIYIKTIKIQTVTLILGAFLFPIRSIASKFFVFLLFFPSLFFPSIFFLMLHFVTWGKYVFYFFHAKLFMLSNFNKLYDFVAVEKVYLFSVNYSVSNPAVYMCAYVRTFCKCNFCYTEI